MKFLLRTLALSLAIGYAAVAPAQYALPVNKLADIPIEVMPAQNNAALLAEEEAARKPGRAPRFAVTIPTKIRPKTHGVWTEEGKLSTWRTRISSPGAETLSLGFSEYRLPEGAALHLLTATDRRGPYTAADNEDHNELWTPVIEGDELMIELRVPTDKKGAVQLYLTNVNHDFMDVNKVLSQGCNVDVICGEEDGFGIVDKYRDIIRSVARIQIGGSLCTGFLVNNASEDGRLLFMTAYHCGVREDNAASVIAYWNYESPTCREVAINANGDSGVGSLGLTNTGTSLLAGFRSSDFTLLELDDPIPPAANVFYAGWSAEIELPTDTLVTIHHPRGHEKRISFSFQEPFLNNYRPNPVDFPDIVYLEVPFWDIGTTEGGSSGGPIFDRFKRVRGQLFGGGASCTNITYDTYGYFHFSWEGDGTPETRLRDWLDPCSTGTLAIDGLESSEIPKILTTATNCISACITTETNIPFTLGTDFPAGTTLEVANIPPGISPGLSTTTASGGQTVNLLIPGDVANAVGTYQITVTATTAGFSDDITFTVTLTDDIAPTPTPNFPADGATDVSPVLELSWNPVADVSGYDLQLSEDSDFTNTIDVRLERSDVFFSLPNALTRNTTYFWRVRGVNNCGGGEWATSSFTTTDLGCALDQGENLPVIIVGREGEEQRVPLAMESTFLIDGSIEVAVDIDHSYLGDLSGRLRSPAGTEIQLFDRVDNGSCSGTNMSVKFSDDASMSANDFNGNCNTGPLASSGVFQPAEPFSSFAGEDGSGVWTLIITDNADGDGGSIERFDLSFCTSSIIAALSVSSSIDMLEACQSSNETSLVLNLGADFFGNVVLEANANGQTLNNFTTSYNADDQTIDVLFSAWSLLEPGTYDLNLVVTNGDGATRTLTMPLVVSSGPASASLNVPAAAAEVQEGEVTFSWGPVAGANDYLFQYATTENFATITFEQQVSGTVIRLNDVPTGDPVFWRIVSRDQCGDNFSEVRQLRVIPAGLHDFGGGRELSIYPNPVQRLLTVEATGSWPKGVNGALYDATGRQLSTYRMAGNGLEQWDLGAIPAGIYYLRFMGLGTERTERLVVLP